MQSPIQEGGDPGASSDPPPGRGGQQKRPKRGSREAASVPVRQWAEKQGVCQPVPPQQ